ncbi:MAG TPA: hypothetical protein VNN10_14155 [Dehalococcoidia bacterium]|nr:hypothetical protein [Dehalococcoidia bacterium]
MCITCACNTPEDNHGDPKNITLSQFREAAKATGTDMDGLLRNINQGFQRYAGVSQPAGSSPRQQR